MSSAAQFTGSVPERYDRYMVPWLFEPYAADLAARLPDRHGLRVLELAAGTGAVTRRLRDALPSGATLVATDLNDAMIDFARSAVPDADITWHQADAQSLPFSDGSFDVVVCQFGFMFLPDKAQGFREARRVLGPDGLLLGNVWHSRDENPVARLLQELLEERLADNAPRFLDTPYGYGDHERLRADLEAAGWDDIRLDVVRKESDASSAEDVALGFLTGSPLSHELGERGVDPADFKDDLTKRLAELGGERPFRAELAATVITAAR
jgi:ubiquinone/menaquinone biosynthesis C-methylase UbiE